MKRWDSIQPTGLWVSNKFFMLLKIYGSNDTAMKRKPIKRSQAIHPLSREHFYP